MFDDLTDLDEDLLDDEELDDMFRVDLGLSERDFSPDPQVNNTWYKTTSTLTSLYVQFQLVSVVCLCVLCFRIQE